ncbi:hypothetical protein BO78DRAFT_396626 [Aspergillus sclerotiicarbonarius CBS 121057]|uniref:Uncharacterized protein n=1 Tax=Aspergillus sclerotiicarbonarius (strain CBS 121057 / IBT 28362) TaxID=1448318 RepID=A0A319EB06_ASPSB|nr:hypothetical protein BO78DRAFT_396626 [Aspergillus sclerotiicarbonarius CBS 121057]
MQLEAASRHHLHLFFPIDPASQTTEEYGLQAYLRSLWHEHQTSDLPSVDLVGPGLSSVRLDFPEDYRSFSGFSSWRAHHY